MGLVLVWCHRLICIVLSLCKHACKEVCDVKQGIDRYPLLARSCDRWWQDFVTFTARKISIFGLKRGKMVQCVSNRCKDLFKRKKGFGVMGSLKWERSNGQIEQTACTRCVKYENCCPGWYKWLPIPGKVFVVCCCSIFGLFCTNHNTCRCLILSEQLTKRFDY